MVDIFKIHIAYTFDLEVYISSMLFSLLKHYLDLDRADTVLKVS